MNKLKQLYFSFTQVLLFAIVVKILLINVTIADSISLAVLAGLHGYAQYLARFKPYNLDEETKKELLEIKGALGKLTFAKSVDKLENKKYF